jgi:hypothetical protein
MPDGRSYWCREYLCATFIADSDEVPWFGEAWPFSSDAICNEGRVLFGFLIGQAFMSHEIVGANVSDEIKEEPLHDRTTKVGPFRSREVGLAARETKSTSAPSSQTLALPHGRLLPSRY